MYKINIRVKLVVAAKAGAAHLDAAAVSRHEVENLTGWPRNNTDDPVLTNISAVVHLGVG